MNNTKINTLISILVVIIFVIIWARYWYIKNLENKKLVAEYNKKIEKLENRKSELDKIQDEILKTTNETKVLSQTIETLQKDYETKIWKNRCLEIKGQMELKTKENKLDCNKDLEKFATYNINETLEKLGL